jgi:hypothetical protein
MSNGQECGVVFFPDATRRSSFAAGRLAEGFGRTESIDAFVQWCCLGNPSSGMCVGHSLGSDCRLPLKEVMNCHSDCVGNPSKYELDVLKSSLGSLSID